MRTLIVDEPSGPLMERVAAAGHKPTIAHSREEAISFLNAHECEAVLCCWTGDETRQFVRQVRAEIAWQYVVTIVLAADVEERLVVEVLEAGADEVLPVNVSARELRARLQSAERVANLGRALAQSNRQLRADLDAGARFARSLLPRPTKIPWAIDYRHIAASAVSGDAFGFHWIDAERLAVYLLDASGHGLDAALLAVSILNILRTETLPEADFRKPDEVLTALSRAFPMEEHGDKCFSIWYGVANQSRRTLSWSGAGHPPAVLIPGKGEPQFLRSQGPVMGALEFAYPVQSISISPRSRLYVYSDGLSEIRTGPDQHRSNEEFVAVLRSLRGTSILDELIENHAEFRHGLAPADDVSVIEVRF